MDDLPDESFTLILDLVPIREIFVLMRVSKRWAAACRFVVRTRQSLSIGSDWYEENARGMRDWHRDRPSKPLDNIIPANRSLESAMMKSLNRMENISRLCVYYIGPEAMSPFVRKFADQLTLLEVDFAISKLGADVFPHLTHLKCSLFDAKTSAAFPRLTELVCFDMDNRKKLPNMRLPSLKKLLIMLYVADAELVSEFVQANAENLTVLEMGGIPLRVDPAVVFPNLKKVDCRDMNDASICAFPALTHLTIARQVTAEFLHRLPADQMLSLEVDFRRGRKDVVSAISKMKNLTSLMLTEWESDDAYGKLSSIFNNMHHLEKVRLVHSVSFKEQDDRIVAELLPLTCTRKHISLNSVHVIDNI